jgi:predicted N-acetyltransferase YhbS
MKNIVIREIEAGDLTTIKAMIDEAWDWAELVESQKVLDATLGLYLNQILYESSFARVAVLDNKVVGCIFGFVDGEAPKYRMLQEDGLEHSLTLLNATECERKDVYECISKLNGVYDQLISGKEDLYDGTLDFFVVSEEVQGLGIGKMLWHELGIYFQEKNAKSIYVYTDSECNVEFYDHSGFQRKSEQELTYTFSDGDWTVDVYLYDYQF